MKAYLFNFLRKETTTNTLHEINQSNNIIQLTDYQLKMIKGGNDGGGEDDGDNPIGW